MPLVLFITPVLLPEGTLAVNDMEQTTQQNAAMVQQASAAALQLQDEADRLNQVVARFTLPRDGNEPLPPAHGAQPTSATPALPAF